MADIVDYNKKPKKIEKVADGKIRKKSLGSKFADVFLSDSLTNVKEYVLMDVIVPAIKNTIVDIIQNGAEMLFFGTTKASQRLNKGGNNFGSVSYIDYSKSGSRGRTEGTRDRNRVRLDGRDILFDERGAAEEALSDLFDLIQVYKAASFADLLQLAGLGDQADTYGVNNKYGWVDITGVSVKPTRGGYYIDLPKPILLD